MKAEFQWIKPEELRNVWETIRPGLVETAKKAPGGWIPEDIYHSIKNGDSVLHLVLAEKYYRGFVVTKSLDTLEGRKLLIWIVHGDGSDNLLVDSFEQFKEWAQNIGAVKIQFQSPRKAWEKVADKLGFTAVQIVYEIDA